MDRQSAKLLLNSLYGRLGMKPNLDIIEVVDTETADKILSKYEVKLQYSITNELEYIKYSNKPISQFQEIHSKDEYLDFATNCDHSNISINQSIPIAIAITAYSRMYMFNIIYKLLDLGFTIYYMDTDSLIVDRPLPDWMVTNNELGKLKLEHFVKEGVFLAPKVYALKTDDGKEIIKVKGLSLNTIRKDLTFDIMLSLLNKDKSLVFNQIKSFRNFKNTHTLTPNSARGH